MLDRPFQRSRPKRRIVTCLCNEIFCRIGQIYLYLPFWQAFLQDIELQIHDPCDFGKPQRMENDYFVKAVKEFRFELLVHHLHHFLSHFNLLVNEIKDPLASVIGSHNNDRILKIYSASVTICEPPVIEYLEQEVNCLLYTSDAADDLLCVDLGGRR